MYSQKLAPGSSVKRRIECGIRQTSQRLLLFHTSVFGKFPQNVMDVRKVTTTSFLRGRSAIMFHSPSTHIRIMVLEPTMAFIRI